MNKNEGKLLEDIKKLIMLDLIQRGTQAQDIARVLGIGKSRIAQIIPARQIKKKP